jgi:hypothetical protein
MNDQDEKKNRLTRRNMLGMTAAGATGVIGGIGLSRIEADAEAQTAPAQPAQSPHGRTEVAPGELDEYYVFSSSGQTGEVRIVGLPSMRELMRIPVFNLAKDFKHFIGKSFYDRDGLQRFFNDHIGLSKFILCFPRHLTDIFPKNDGQNNQHRESKQHKQRELGREI